MLWTKKMYFAVMTIIKREIIVLNIGANSFSFRACQAQIVTRYNRRQR